MSSPALGSRSRNGERFNLPAGRGEAIGQGLDLICRACGHAAHVGHTGAIAVVGVSTEDQVLAPHGAQTVVVAIGGVILVLTGGLRRPGRSREELVQATTSAEEEVARLTRLTNDLLILAHTDEGMLPVKSAPTRVRDLLERSADRAAGRAAPAAVVVEADPALVAMLDQDRIRQAVDNLVDNALRFTPAGSQVRITARARGPDLVIEVADAGPGFPAEFLPGLIRQLWVAELAGFRRLGS